MKGTGISGKLIYSQIVLDRPGWFMGAIMTEGTAEDAKATDIAKVTFFDSANDSIDGSTNVLGMLTPENMKIDIPCTCREGIYAEVEEGAECIVYYSM